MSDLQGQFGDGLRILVIDDSASDRALLASKLSHAGHHAVCVDSSDKGIEEFLRPENIFDLILLDVLMPDAHGHDITRKVRELEVQHNMHWHPIFLMSGRVEPEDIEAGITAGADDYLNKPVNTKILRAKLTALSRVAQLRRQLLDLEQRLEQESNTDNLTGMANRRNFVQLLGNEISRAKRHGTALSLAYIGIDNIQQLYAEQSSEQVDNIIRRIAHFCAENLRQGDTLGRISAEDFCLCMPHTDINGAQAACDRYRDGLAQLDFSDFDAEIHLSASLGVTAYHADTDSLMALLGRAEAAMQQARQTGNFHIQTLLANPQTNSQRA